MSRRYGRVMAAGVATLSLLGLAAFAAASADDEETPTIKVVMQKLHKGAKAPLAGLKTELAKDKPDWDAVQKKTKDFVILGAALAKNDPPKGGKDSWKKLSDSFFEASKKMDDGAKKEDAKATKDAYKTVSTSCMACHKAHKG